MVLASAAGAQARSPLQRPGGVIGIGLAPASFLSTCAQCRDDGVIGLDREVTLGVSLGARLQLGVAVAGWLGRGAGASPHEAAIMGTVRTYPVPTRPLHLDLGIGAGRYRLALVHNGSPTQRLAADGLAWSVGAGYDLRIGRELVLVPQITYRRIVVASIDQDGTPFASSGFRVLGFGAAIRWRILPFTHDLSRE